MFVNGFHGILVFLAVMSTWSIATSDTANVACTLRDDGACYCKLAGRVDQENRKCPIVFDEAEKKVEHDQDVPMIVIFSSTRAGMRWHKTTLPAPPRSYTRRDMNATRVEQDRYRRPRASNTTFGGASKESPMWSSGAILGFGGAFTDAAAHVLIETLDPALTTHVLQGYFSVGGLHYTTGRTHMGSVDFSRHSYELLPEEDDWDLSSFRLCDDSAAGCGHDYKIDLIRLANATATESRPAGIQSLFFAPWSPPHWMKEMCNPKNPLYGGRLYSGASEGDQGAERARRVRLTYAKLFVKFVEAYKKGGVHIWGVSPQNEPWILQPTDCPFESCHYDAAELADFVERYLGPELESSGLGHIAIFGFDGMWPALQEYFAAYNLTCPPTRHHYVSGFGFHWYMSEQAILENTSAIETPSFLRWLFPSVLGGGANVWKVRQQLGSSTSGDHKTNANRFLLATEACTGVQANWRFASKGPAPGDWSRGYAYARDIFYQLLNGANGWTDWNLALDIEGGPNHVNNLVDAPVLVGKGGSYFILNPMYYFLGHISHFLVPLSLPLRVLSTLDTNRGMNDDGRPSWARRAGENYELRVVDEGGGNVEKLAYVTPPHGDVIIILLNGPFRIGSNVPKIRVNRERIQLSLRCAGEAVADAVWEMEEHSIQTLRLANRYLSSCDFGA